MHETSKALRRRMRDPNFATKYMRGRAIDIGSGPDPLSRQLGYWPLLTSVDCWDKEDGDAQLMEGAPDGAYDLVYSSHTLEHMRDRSIAIQRWWRLVAPYGHLVVVVPDWDLYERRVWPSKKNPDHKHYFTLPIVASLLDLLDGADPIKIERITEHFEPLLPPDVDQTMGLAEACIEFIVHKPA